jgi:hypothetical protein
MYLNGHGIGNAAYTQKAIGGNTYIFNDNGGSAHPFDGIVDHALIWSRGLLPSEIAHLYESPFDAFQSPRRRTISAVASGGIAFNPDWARQRSVIIGAGLR